MKASRFFLLLLLLKLATADRLRYHLENLIDRNVSACDDFYHHACSQHVDRKEFFQARVWPIFSEATERLLPESIKNSPIEYDLQLTRGSEYNFEDNDYENLARTRCKEDISCFLADQSYYKSAIRELIAAGWDLQQASIHPDESLESTISNCIADTVSMIKELASFMNATAYQENSEAVRFHNTLQTRLAMIEFMKTNRTYGDFHEIQQISLLMKVGMVKNIEESAWLHGDEISEFIGQKMKERVASIEVFHDFDELDRNGSMLLKLNRDLNHIYFSEKRNTGILGLDTLLGLSNAFNKLQQSSTGTEAYFLIRRVLGDFVPNASFDESGQMKAITILAPYMYRPLHDSEIMKEPIIMYATIGHELYHSMFTHASPLLLDLYNHRGECVKQHYRTACDKYKVGECASGDHTFTEDGADVEGFRITHEHLKQVYSQAELNKSIEGLETTLEQAFFYYAASEYCSTTAPRTAEHAQRDVHSANNIRVNAAFSLMPEFSRAFQCKEGDRMYIEEEKSCYIFGPKAKR